MASVERITEYHLKNGLRVLLFPDPSKATITVNITYLVGSRHEGYGETGMAHLLEHLVFKGTPKHPNIPQELTERGARPNGTTWYDRTNYYETFAANEANLRWALDLEAAFCWLAAKLTNRKRWNSSMNILAVFPAPSATSTLLIPVNPFRTASAR
ncbi:MAG: insulinase family protein [Saprospiraceae bacterium]|nr:insulinase family protein [Saprospiraceae bacterium]